MAFFIAGLIELFVIFVLLINFVGYSLLKLRVITLTMITYIITAVTFPFLSLYNPFLWISDKIYNLVEKNSPLDLQKMKIITIDLDGMERLTLWNDRIFIADFPGFDASVVLIRTKELKFSGIYQISTSRGCDLREMQKFKEFHVFQLEGTCAFRDSSIPYNESKMLKVRYEEIKEVNDFGFIVKQTIYIIADYQMSYYRIESPSENKSLAKRFDFYGPVGVFWWALDNINRGSWEARNNRKYQNHHLGAFGGVEILPLPP